MSLKIVKGLIKLNYLPKNVSLSRKNLKNLIKEGMYNAKCNLLLDNVPIYSTPRDLDKPEKVTEDHIFETLQEFGSPQGLVIRVTPHCYIAYATDAEDIVKVLSGNNIDGNELRVEYHELAKPLVVCKNKVVIGYLLFLVYLLLLLGIILFFCSVYFSVVRV